MSGGGGGSSELIVELDDSWNDTSAIHEGTHDLCRPLNLEAYYSENN